MSFNNKSMHNATSCIGMGLESSATGRIVSYLRKIETVVPLIVCGP